MKSNEIAIMANDYKSYFFVTAVFNVVNGGVCSTAERHIAHNKNSNKPNTEQIVETYQSWAHLHLFRDLFSIFDFTLNRLSLTIISFRLILDEQIGQIASENMATRS